MCGRVQELLARVPQTLKNRDQAFFGFDRQDDEHATIFKDDHPPLLSLPAATARLILPHPNEVTVTVRNPVPELEVRRDVRRHLEFVANRLGVNPQPRLSLIVEGQSEEAAIVRIFEDYFGSHPGILGIEIVVLGVVDAATGGKKDRFRAIMRLP